MWCVAGSKGQRKAKLGHKNWQTKAKMGQKMGNPRLNWDLKIGNPGQNWDRKMGKPRPNRDLKIGKPRQKAHCRSAPSDKGAQTLALVHSKLRHLTSEACSLTCGKVKPATGREAKQKWTFPKTNLTISKSQSAISESRSAGLQSAAGVQMSPIKMGLSHSALESLCVDGTIGRKDL